MLTSMGKERERVLTAIVLCNLGSVTGNIIRMSLKRKRIVKNAYI